jgi:hypothetical protein
MSTTSLYVRDEELWERARKHAGSQGLSSLVEQAVRQHLDRQEPLTGTGVQTFVLPVATDDESGEMGHSIEFQGQLVVDSEGFSLEQLPRVRVYRTVKGRLVVYRTWPPHFQFASSYSLYSDIEKLESDPLALSTMWITDEDMLGEHADLTPRLARALRKSLSREAIIVIDELEPPDTKDVNRPVRLSRDADVVRRALQGRADRDVLLVAMHLLSATGKDPRHLSESYKAFAKIKPLSRLGKRPEDLKELPAAVRGYLNDETRKQSPTHRLFTNPKRGFWGLSNIGESRATEVLHQVGMVRG